VEEPARLPHTKTRVKVKAGAAGFVHGINALELGLTGVSMGAGRTRADQDVDPAVGIVLEKVRGDRVNEGDTLAMLHVHGRKGSKVWADRVAAAYEIKRSRPKVQPLVLDVIRR